MNGWTLQRRIESKMRTFIGRTNLSTWFYFGGAALILASMLFLILRMGTGALTFTLVITGGISMCIAIYIGVTNQ